MKPEKILIRTERLLAQVRGRLPHITGPTDVPSEYIEGTSLLVTEAILRLEELNRVLDNYHQAAETVENLKREAA